MNKWERGRQTAVDSDRKNCFKFPNVWAGMCKWIARVCVCVHGRGWANQLRQKEVNQISEWTWNWVKELRLKREEINSSKIRTWFLVCVCVNWRVTPHTDTDLFQIYDGELENESVKTVRVAKNKVQQIAQFSHYSQTVHYPPLKNDYSFGTPLRWWELNSMHSGWTSKRIPGRLGVSLELICMHCVYLALWTCKVCVEVLYVLHINFSFIQM